MGDALKAFMAHIFILVFDLFYAGLLVFACVLTASWAPMILGLTLFFAVCLFINRKREKNYRELLENGEYVKNWDPSKSLEAYVELVKNKKGIENEV